MAEYYDQLKLQDGRFYRLLCCWVKDPPSFGSVFSLWGEAPAQETEDTDNWDLEEDERAFRQVTAALTPFRNGSIN